MMRRQPRSTRTATPFPYTTPFRSFHLARTAFEFDGRTLTLDNGDTLEADLIVVGIGVRPRTSLAKSANISVEDGLLVNEYLETSVPGIYAAGDIARYPDARSEIGRASCRERVWQYV